MRPFFRGRPLLLGWCLVALRATTAHAETMPLSTVPESGIMVEIEGWAGISPHNTAGRDVGLIPLVVTVTNGSPFDRTWTVEPNRTFGQSAGVVPVARIAVPAGGTSRATVYVDPGRAGVYSSGWLKVRGFGLSGGEQSFHVDAWTHMGSTPSTATAGMLPSAISRDAYAKRGTALERYFIPGGLGLDLATAPDDWRGWSAFSSLLFDESEWVAMSAGQRKALLDWIGLGGRAGLMVTDASAERLDRIGLPAADPDGRRRVGAGEIVPVAWDGKELVAAEVDRFLAGRSTHPKSERLGGYVDSSTGFSKWTEGFRRLFDTFGPRQLPTAAILGFLAIFGIVAGPLNVMMLAGPGRRSRMFWTTPLISILATAFLLGLMFLRDGVGGTGARRVLGLLMPEQNGMAIIQEQFSRTGVLAGSSFPIREPSWMRPLGDIDVEEGLFEVDGRQRQGDWFRSRSDQAFLLETVRPSRAKIELVGGGDGSPAVISSIEVPLDRLYVIDDDGTYWTAEDVGTGERKPLGRSDADAYGKWFDGIAGDAGPIRKAALEAVRNRRGHAFAEATGAAKVAVQTLGSIRWVDDKAAFVGPVTRTTEP